MLRVEVAREIELVEDFALMVNDGDVEGAGNPVGHGHQGVELR